jgi:hypothetical protein
LRISPACRLPVTVAAVVTGTLTWVPTATAQPTEPTPSAAVADTSEPDEGSIAIVKNDPAGEVLEGAAFVLLDVTGQESGSGNTHAQGKLTFTGLVPGVYRLKGTTSGSPLHAVVTDQDVIVTPGATVNIGSGEKTLLTLTTGPNGTAPRRTPSAQPQGRVLGQAGQGTRGL